MKKIILIGAGGHAESCVDLLNEQSIFKLSQIIGKKEELKIKILGKFLVNFYDQDLSKLSKKYKYAIIGVGQIRNYKTRYKLFNKLKVLGFKIPTIISSNAIVSKYSLIDEGTVVMHGAIIGPNVKIGKNCIINSNALIEHGCVIGDNCHISTSVTLNSGVKVGSNTFIGSGTVAKQGINIKKNSFIKMSSKLIKNL